MSEVESRGSCRGLFKKLDIVCGPCQYTPSLIVFVIDNQNNIYTGTWIKYKTQKSTLHPYWKSILLFKSDSFTQELRYLTDFPVIFSISGKRVCILRINLINILLLIHFIQLQNF
jgi:hypothetical protein